MTAKRHDNLLCPIARALDAVGDRWTLLILRDLHAGPARYQELHEGLGIATNLLSTRLTEMTDGGLIRKPSERGAYELTDLGASTDRILWELARFGGGLDFYITESIVASAGVDYLLPTGDVEDLDYVSFGWGLQYRF